MPHEGELAPVEELVSRLEHVDPDCSALITTASLPVDPHRGAATFVPLPGDKRTEIQMFLNHWAPDVCVWTRGTLRPTALSELEERGTPIFLVDASAADFPQSRFPWSGMRQKSMLRRFDRILATDNEAAARLKTLGARPWIIEPVGALEEGSIALSASEAERTELAEELVTRPVWYATDLPSTELSLVFDAHGEALRRAHRFLLVITPAEDLDAKVLAAAAEAEGYRTVLRSETDEIDPEVQVLVANLPDEYGLWYRLAPLCYFGGTFSKKPNRNPFEAAALGSAIVFGPDVRRFRSQFERLRLALGARALEAPEELGTAISELSSPDRSARLAHAAWDVSSSGAGVTDRVFALIRDALAKRVGAR